MEMLLDQKSWMRVFIAFTAFSLLLLLPLHSPKMQIFHAMRRSWSWNFVESKNVFVASFCWMKFQANSNFNQWWQGGFQASDGESSGRAWTFELSQALYQRSGKSFQLASAQSNDQKPNWRFLTDHERFCQFQLHHQKKLLPIGCEKTRKSIQLWLGSSHEWRQSSFQWKILVWLAQKSKFDELDKEKRLSLLMSFRKLWQKLIAEL